MGVLLDRVLGVRLDVSCLSLSLSHTQKQTHTETMHRIGSTGVTGQIPGSPTGCSRPPATGLLDPITSPVPGETSATTATSGPRPTVSGDGRTDIPKIETAASN